MWGMLLLLVAPPPGEPASAAETRAPAAVDFEAQIRPLLNRHCVACHGGVTQAGDVSFVTAEDVLPPDGWVVEPGDAANSTLIQRINDPDVDFRMPPPEEGSLTAEEIALLSRWVEEGAAWATHWAFVPPTPRQPAVAADDPWVRQRVDRFVLARLNEEGVEPAPPAAADRWLRRAWLALTGLPPSVEQRAAFLADVADRGEPAYAAAVDRMLDSPHFGERWASVWLDQVRYADSEGLGQDRRRTAWPFRDWVVRAFNDDMPYDRFTRLQIAGDLTEDPSTDDLVATVGQRLTQTNDEGGTDDEEFRTVAVLDRVSTTWQTWQGLTVGCAQCHDHPYDPVTQTDYYRFVALFNNTADSDTHNDYPLLDVPTDREDVERFDSLRRRLSAARLARWQAEYDAATAADWQPLAISGTAQNASPPQFQTRRGQTEYLLKDTSKNTSLTLTAPLPQSLGQVTAVRFTGMPVDLEKAIRDSEWGFSLSRIKVELLPGGDTAAARDLPLARVIGDDPVPYYDPQRSLKKGGDGFGVFSRMHYPRSGVFILKSPADVAGGDRLRVSLHFNQFILASFVMAPRRGYLEVTGDVSLTGVLDGETYVALRDAETSLQMQADAIDTVRTPILRERDARFPRRTHRFDRGNFLTKAEEVHGGLPSVLAGETDADNRLALADWLASADNPLTDRVAVNRFWARLLGVGLVATEEDFGSSGDRPSHPDLLDDLAVRFRTQMGRRPKELLRELVLSATYRQSTAERPQLSGRDPDNRLLARGPRFRLPAETVRDQALAVSGLLEDTMGGPPAFPPIPEGVWKSFAGDKWETPAAGEAGRYRRSLYTYAKRSIPYPMFASFDAPSREFCVPRRLRSNTPVQSLMTLNDETFDDAARALATAIRSGDVAASARAGVLRVTLREPTEDEVRTLTRLHERLTELADEDTAWVELARVLLNLDELFST